MSSSSSKHATEKIQLVNELHKPARKNYPRRRTIIKGLDDLWQSDLVEMAYNWLDILPEITDNYNESRHSTTGYKSIDVTKSKEKLILKTVYNHIKISGVRKFKVGDILSPIFLKIISTHYTPNCTTELFKITAVKITNPITCLLEDMRGQPIQGVFYAEELQKTTNPDVYLVEKVLRRKGQKIYVKCLGLDQSHNSWIEKKKCSLIGWMGE
ncbi:hypothetical protein NQ315_012837 [Exocentrus adspersus]|uniref:Chromo domain-containing protein n=1 Tax=Exocentrus adspersus TaxID=1586481 RepID=A0AAV8V5T3_9CUCU|nr:hypothetical protein NQ315_012837 [Exocentrus adspersus]